MAKHKNKAINLNDPEIRRRRLLNQKGYRNKIFSKIASRVHAEAKKQGIRQSWTESQRFASKYVYPDYRDELLSKIDLHEVDRVIVRGQQDLSRQLEVEQPEQLPVQESCASVWDVPDAIIISIDWWDIQNTLNVLPGNLNIRINAGSDFGVTEIAQNNDFPYHASPIKSIVERIRAAVANASGPIWSGSRKVKPGRKDDGKDCSYFIDFILFVDGIPVGSSDSIDTEVFEAVVPEEKVPEHISPGEKMEILKNREKERKKAQADREKQQKAKRRERPKQKPAEPEAPPQQNFAEILKQARADFDLGLITKKQFRQLYDMIIKRIGEE